MLHVVFYNQIKPEWNNKIHPNSGKSKSLSRKVVLDNLADMSINHTCADYSLTEKYEIGLVPEFTKSEVYERGMTIETIESDYASKKSFDVKCRNCDKM